MGTRTSSDQRYAISDKGRAAQKRYRDAHKTSRGVYNRRWNKAHRPAMCAAHARWLSASDDARRSVSLAHALRRYGVTLDALHMLFEKQEERCAVCTKIIMPLPDKNTCIDHDHHTNIVRGLLCTNCNLGLGQFADSSSTLRAAAMYLERHAPGVSNGPE